jgi:hypothetical protein
LGSFLPKRSPLSDTNVLAARNCKARANAYAILTHSVSFHAGDNCFSSEGSLYVPARANLCMNLGWPARNFLIEFQAIVCIS